MGRFYNPASTVHAQDSYSNCVVSVSRDWGGFRGGSEFGLAFEGQLGTLRFMLHPPCGSLSTPTVNPSIDLKVIRESSPQIMQPGPSEPLDTRTWRTGSAIEISRIARAIPSSGRP